MRKGEIQDKTYHFVSEEEFLDKLNSEFFLEHKKYETAELRDITLKWRGSSNQRVIDVKRSLKQGKVILWENQ